jgi:hypothetical protein
LKDMGHDFVNTGIKERLKYCMKGKAMKMEKG